MKKSQNQVKFLWVGSRAMNLHLPPHRQVVPKDFDVIYAETNEEVEIGKVYSALGTDTIEFHTLPKDLFAKLLFDHRNYNSFYENIGIPTLEALYVLKLSHAEYNIHWHKTVSHIQIMKKQLKINYGKPDFNFNDLLPEYKDLFYSLKKHWRVIHGKRKEQISLQVSKEKFFNNKVPRIYEHDYLHECVSYYNEPLYKSVLKNGHSVLIDEDKFNLLPFDDRLRLAKEEIYAIALERYLLPYEFKACTVNSYQRALRKVVIELSKGWFPTFIVDNYDKMYKMDFDYAKKFREVSKYDTAQ